MSILKKVWEHLEEYFLISSFFVIVPLVFTQIVARYVFSNSISWSEELARYIFLWQIWIGASFATKKWRHIRIEFIKTYMPSIAAKTLEIVVLLLWMFFAGFLAVKGMELTSMIFEMGQRSAAMRMPMGFAYLSVPVGTTLMCLRILEKLIPTIKAPTESFGKTKEVQ